MSRVDENREARRLLEQRRREQQHAEQTRRDGNRFGRLMTERQENTARANQEAEAESGQQARQQSHAGDALLARQGNQANRFAVTLQHQGKQSLDEGKQQAGSRKTEGIEHRRGGGHQRKEAAARRVAQQGEELAAVSRDDRREGDQGSGELGGDERGGKESQLSHGQLDALGQPQGAQRAPPAQQAQATAAVPRVPPEVINQIVERVLVGVGEEGLSELRIELKGNLLAGASIHITASDGEIAARFDSPDANVRRLVRSSEGALARAFERKGLRLARLDVGGP